MHVLRVKYLKSLRQASLGLLAAVEAYPVFFKTRFGIHTFFMKYSIDVLILDKAGRVIALKENLKPFRIFLWNPLFDRVIELPKGTIESERIQTNSTVKLVFLA